MSWKRKRKLLIGILFILFLIIPLQIPKVQQYLSIPNDITVDHRESVASVPTNHTKKETNYPFLTNIDLHPSEVTENEIVYKVGNFPIKKVDVNVLKQHECSGCPTMAGPPSRTARTAT